MTSSEIIWKSYGFFVWNYLYGRAMPYPSLKMHLSERVKPWPAATNVTIFRGGSWRYLPLEMLFLGGGWSREPPLKITLIFRVGWGGGPPLKIFFYGRVRCYSNPFYLWQWMKFWSVPEKNRGIPTNCFCSSAIYNKFALLIHYKKIFPNK